MTAGQVNKAAETGPSARSPWRSRDFGMYMVGYTASDFAGQISTVAIPLVAVFTVGASSFEVGVMRTVNQLPYLLFVLLFGVVVDQWRRRNMLVFADFGRAMALVAIPVAFALHSLGIPALYMVAFLVGVCTVLFDVGSQAYLPRLVEPDQLAQANSRMESLRSASIICGPAIGGVIVAWFSAPNALIVCVVFFLVSAGAIWRIRKSEPKPEPNKDAVSRIGQIGEGFRLVFGNPVLRSVAAIVAMFNFCYAGYLAIYVVYLPVELKLSSYAIGLAFAAMGPGLLVGALFSSWLPKRFGYGRVLITCAIASNLFLLGVSVLHGNSIATIGLLIFLNFMYGCLSQTFTVALVTIRQSITPDRILGRVMATYRFLGVGLVPVGSLLGGFLGEQSGLRTGLFAISLAMCMVPFFFLRSALTRLGRELPVAAEARRS